MDMPLGDRHVQNPTARELPSPPPGKTGWPWTDGGDSVASAPSSDHTCPRITIVTPSSNQAEFLEATMRSVLLQGYSNLEYFVMDGNSTDNSCDVIRKYETWVTDWVSESDRGQSHAINKGLAKGTGRILSWLNSDDLLMPGALQAVAKLAEKNPQATAWIGQCHRIDPQGWLLTTVVPRGLTRDKLADWGHRGWFYQPSCFFSATAWHKVGPIDESLHFALDLDLWLRLVGAGEFASMRHVLSAATIHPRAKTQAQRAAMHKEIRLVQRKHGYVRIAELREADESNGGSLKHRMRRALRVKLGQLFSGAMPRRRIAVL